MRVVRWDRGAQRFSAEKMQKVGLFSSERLFCDLYCLESGQSQKPHMHGGSDKVYFVVEGEGKFQIGDEERHLGEGEATMAAAGELHGILNESANRLVVLTLMTPPPS